MTEPRWIAYELHDGLLQWVIGARMHVAGMLARLDQQRPPEDARADLAQLLAFLNQAAEEGRHLIGFIEGLDSEGAVDVVRALSASCEVLSRKVRAGQPPIEFQPPTPPWPDMPPPAAWSIVRITQQAIINAVRHSGGSLVTVSPQSSGGQLSVVVRDNGHGFDPAAEYPGHFGLKSMRHRARQSGLDLQLESSTMGTTVTVTVRAPSHAEPTSLNLPSNQ